MTTAPVADQHRLLDLQALDTRAAQLNHQRRSLPQHRALEELAARAEDLRRSQVGAGTELSDHRRELSKAEGDVEQVRQRAARHQSRLDSGSVATRDAQALQEELAQLARRQDELEEVELAAMEQVESDEQRLAELAEIEAGINADVERQTSERDAELVVIDRELEELAAQRQALAAELDEGLVAMYERIRTRTGGLGAIALRGQRTEGARIDLTLSELDALKSAAPEEVITSEEYGYIIVRMDQE